MTGLHLILSTPRRLSRCASSNIPFWIKVLCFFVLGATTAVLLFVNMDGLFALDNQQPLLAGRSYATLFISVFFSFSFSVLGRTTRDSGLVYPVYGSVSALPLAMCVSSSVV